VSDDATPATQSPLEDERTHWAKQNHRRLTAWEKGERNRELMSLRIRRPDLSTQAIAWRFGISRRQVQTIIAECAEYHKKRLKTEDPVDVMNEHIQGLVDLRGQAGELAADWRTQDNVKLGCMKLTLMLRMQEIELRQRMGLLPDLETIADQLDTRFATERIAEVLLRHNVPESEIAELAAVLKGEVTVQSIVDASHEDDDWIGDDDEDV
jgi:hypothetical protein